MTRDKLVFWFIKNFNAGHISMCESNHNVNYDEPNIFHGEGTVWTHTMMVMTVIQEKNYDPIDNTILLTAALLHDTGKPICEELKEASDTKPIRNSFHGHEGVSTMIAVDVLKKLQKDFPNDYTDEVIKLILQVISLHGVSIDGENSYLLELRKSLRYADKMGACRNVDEDIFSQYEKRKFIKHKPNPNKELVLMVGLPCSGKSTYVENNFKDYVKISRDDLLLDQYNILMNTENKSDEFFDYAAKFGYNAAYRFIHETEERLKKFNEFFDGFIRKVSKENDKVLIDMTMMSLKSRRTMMNNFHNFTKHAVVCFTDSKSLQKRNDLRSIKGKSIPNHVFMMMSKQFVMPVKEEGFETITLNIN